MNLNKHKIVALIIFGLLGAGCSQIASTVSVHPRRARQRQTSLGYRPEDRLQSH